MRVRILECGWLTAVLCTLVVWAATSLVLSPVTIGGAASAWAANEDVPGPAKGVGKSVGEKLAGEQRSDDEPAAEKDGPGKPDAAKKDAGEKGAALKDVPKKAAAPGDAAPVDELEKAPAGKTADKKGGDAKDESDKGDKAADKKSTDKKADKNGTDKKGADKKGTDKKGTDKKAADKKLVDKTIDNLDKKLDDKDLDEKGMGEKGAVEKAGAGDAIGGKESFLTWLYRSLGLRYVVIFLFVTFNAVALIVMIVLGLRRNVICPDELAASFEAKLNEKQYQEAYELAKQSRSFLGKVLAAGMSRLSDGYEESLRAMQEVGEEQNLKLEQRNGYIALIAQIGPMFGLLGTVDGMVMAFDVIAHSNVTPKPSELAQGIGTALVTTVVGLWIAIPLIAFYQIIRNRLSRLVFEAGAVSGNLMKRFATVQVPAKKPTTPER
jgi:biopolymer transport protein ExbB